MQFHFIWDYKTTLVIFVLLLYQFFVALDIRTKVDRESGPASIGVGRPNKPVEMRRATNSF